MPAKVRIPFILRYQQEIPYSEIGQKLALSSQRVRKRVQQARTILKKQLNQYFSELDSSSPSATYQNFVLKGERRTELFLIEELSIKSQEYWENDFPTGEVQFDKELIKIALEKLASESITTYTGKTPITSGCDLESIDYKITATCLEALSPLWYSSPSCLRWR
ncbi:MAG: sigma-70 family RNA polymerase sigma factor [Symploca sp. SIO2E9]|nr:sigma-70 family RNA polymerase sigma factor [Symploca sp. SIO2E9]